MPTVYCNNAALEMACTQVERKQSTHYTISTLVSKTNFKLVYKAYLPLVLGWPCDLCEEDGLDAKGGCAGLGAAAGLDWLLSLIPS